MAKLSRRKILKLGILGGVGLLTTDTFCVEPNWIQTVHIDIPIKNLPKSFDGYKIAQLSDFHVPNYINADAIQDAFRLAKQQKPDLLVLTGDFVHCSDFLHRNNHQLPDLAPAFANLEAPDGVVGVLGNHDWGLDGAAVAKELQTKTNVRLLENRVMIVERGEERIAVVGSIDLWNGDPPLKLIDSLPPEMPRILLQHNPDLAEEMEPGHRVDLQLSGHTHGGQIRIPFGPAPIIPSKYGQKFRSGLVEGKSHRVYVNRGIGNSAPASARLFSRPEVTIIRLRCST